MSESPVYVWLKTKRSTVAHHAHGRGPETACGLRIYGDGRWQSGTVLPASRTVCGRCAAMAGDVAAATGGEA